MSYFSSTQATELLLQALENGHSAFLEVTSDSMAPLFHRGDQIQLSPVSFAGPVPGDIIVIGLPGDLLAHRLCGLTESGGRRCLITRGDRLAYYDTVTPFSQLRAIVTGRRRRNRYLDFAQGTGAWLNHRLAQLSRLETRVMRLPHPSAGVGTKQLTQSGLIRRLLRRALYTIAILLTWLVDNLPI